MTREPALGVPEPEGFGPEDEEPGWLEEALLVWLEELWRITPK